MTKTPEDITFDALKTYFKRLRADFTGDEREEPGATALTAAALVIADRIDELQNVIEDALEAFTKTRPSSQRTAPGRDKPETDDDDDNEDDDAEDPELPDDFDATAEPVVLAQRDPVSVLFETCTQRGLLTPQFKYVHGGSDNAPVFTATITLVDGEQTLRATGRGKTKALAKKDACRALLVKEFGAT